MDSDEIFVLGGMSFVYIMTSMGPSIDSGKEQHGMNGMGKKLETLQF
jgi:hypothetical protein